MATIYPVRFGKTTAYIVEGSSGSILVDTGTPGSDERIRKALSSTAAGAEALNAIVLTHTHYDHVGSLAALDARLEVDVVVHKEEAKCLREGYTPLPRGTSLLPKLIAVAAATFSAKVGRYLAVTPTVTVKKRLDLDPYGVDGYVLPTPGHTAGSLSVILADGAALVGDSLFHFLPGRVYPPFADLPDTLLKSWRMLLETGAHTFYPAHGGPISREQFEKAAKKRIPGY
jgi:glyoxylase-like metal-dependent hydrolase (beta-lactamase superfamily II)